MAVNINAILGFFIFLISLLYIPDIINNFKAGNIAKGAKFLLASLAMDVMAVLWIIRI